MLLAIDVGNTHSVFGLWDGTSWQVWRRHTDPNETEDQIAVWLNGLIGLRGISGRIDRAVCSSVVPALDEAIEHLCEKWLRVPLCFVRNGMSVGLDVRYDPPASVGSDRIVNVVGALAAYQPPLIVVDFGTATKFEAVGKDGAYEGGAILPGVLVSSQALFGRTAKLPQVAFDAPKRAIGKSTTEALQSGIMFGYAAAIDGLGSRIREELGGEAKVIATGGLGKVFSQLCEIVDVYEPTLTLDGLRVASERLF